jgi:hypothetical protein
VYTHKSGGNTVCNEVEQRSRIKIYTAEEATRIVERQHGTYCWNERSARAAVFYSTASTVDDKGNIVKRVSMVRPGGKSTLPQKDLEQSFWKEVGYRDWQRLWEQEIEEMPKFQTSRFFLMTGLLLPIWNTLDTASMRVNRLITDDGKILLGRVIDAQHMQEIAHHLGLSAIKLSPQEIYTLVWDDRKSHQFSGGTFLKKSLVAGESRLHLIGNLSEPLVAQLKAAGCFTEVINWKTQVFIPTTEQRAKEVIGNVSEILDR